MDKAFEDNFSELGYGEGTDEDITKEKELELDQAESLELMDMARQKLEESDDLTRDQKDQVLAVIETNIKAFGGENSRCRMSSLQPMKVQMKHPHPQMMAQGRCLGQQQTIFLRDKLKQLERLGIVECADNPVYGSAAFVVPKQGPKNGEWS